MLGNWACRPDGDWAEPPRSWLDEARLRCVGVAARIRRPLTYAARWLRGEWLAHSDPSGSALDRWLNYYRACGIDAIASGSVVVRKRCGVNWFQGFSVGAEMHGFCGEQLQRLLGIQDYCTNHLRTDEDLLNCRFKLSEHRLEQVFHFEHDRYQLHSSLLRLQEPMPIPIGIDGFGLQLLSKCDGRHTLRDLLCDAAARHDVDVDDMMSSALVSIRNLVTRGFLLPVDLSVA